MSDDEVKAARERASFLEFATVAGLPVVTGTVGSRKPPEPDILCEVQGRGLVAFELVNLIDQGLARMEAQAARGQWADQDQIPGLWYGKPVLEVIREKCRKSGTAYKTPHPIELVVCAGEEEVELMSPSTPEIQERISQLCGMSSFQRIWVVKLTRKGNSVWLVYPGN
jgi:hypothetical protein